MDKTYILSIINGLKSTSSSRVQESLLKIRSKIITNNSGVKLFRECGGLEYLVPHLRKPNEKILDITLSILGNCCLDEECSLAVGKLHCFGPLVSILKTVCRDSIVGRACRVIGNLAQKNTNAENLHNHGVVAALSALITNRDSNTSYPTLTMAVRAMRQLWMVIDKRDEILELNAVRCIAILMTVECETAGIIKSTTPKETEGLRKSQEELLNGILKCLGHFTTYTTADCAEQIQGDGRGYQCLVALTESFESLALKCLMNLCYISSSRPLLGNAGLVDCLVRILQKNSDVSSWPDGAARALAQLSGEAVNRSRLRHSGGLPLLMAAARVNFHAMHALLQYVFDDTAFQILVSEGLVNFLTDELNKHLVTMEYEHNNMEHTDMLSETVNAAENATKSTNFGVSNSKGQSNTERKENLFSRRKSLLSSNNEDELKVVIERDNMIVGFVDAMDSDASDSPSDDENLPLRRRNLKRPRSKSKSPKVKKKSLIRMASRDWSAGVYWEPKSPEWQPQAGSSRAAASPRSEGPVSPRSADREYSYCVARSDGPASPLSDRSGFSPEARGAKRGRWDSPESGFGTGEGGAGSPHWTEYQWSPSSSGPASPLSANQDSSDSEISGRYSPVCSDHEGEGGEVEGGPGGSGLDAAQVAQDLDDLIMEDEESLGEAPLEDIPSAAEGSTRSSQIAIVLVLLFRVSHGSGGERGAGAGPSAALEPLAAGDCLHALLDYVQRCRRPLGRAARILARVMSNALCLKSILKHRLALRLHSMSVDSKHPPAKCQQCKQILRLSTKLLRQLTILAESSYGIGEISYQLLKGPVPMRETLSITLPYIVKAEKPLKKYFVDCGALSLLFTVVAEGKEQAARCGSALAQLAAAARLKDPKTLENKFSGQVCVSYDPILDHLSKDDIVRFELDDLTTVEANRRFLCQNSDVFSAMLMGCFKESIEKCVRLKNVTKPGLEYLLTLLHCGVDNPKCDVVVFPMAKELDTNLEVLLLADRFLFEKLKGLLSSAILQFQLNPQTADKIYVWSLNEGMGFLCVESVAYLLTGKMTDSERSQSFKNIMSLEYKDQWLDDIKSMILRHLIK